MTKTLTTTTDPIIASRSKRAREYYASEDGGATVSILATSLAQALEAASQWCAGGDYDPEYCPAVVTQTVRVWRASVRGRDLDWMTAWREGQGDSRRIEIPVGR